MRDARRMGILAAALVVVGAVVLLLRDAREEVPVPEGGSAGVTAPAPAVPGALPSDPRRPVPPPTAARPTPVAAPNDGAVPLAGRKTKSLDNVRSMGSFYLASGAGVTKPWPRHSGKAFVLWLVASNKLDRRDPEQLGILFSPGDADRSLARAGGIEAYAKLTLESLTSEDPGRGALTSYAGRRNSEREHVLTPAELSADAPILADLSFPDGAIVGYTSGASKWLTREELGLGPNDPIVAGDESKSPILRQLSSE